MTYQRMRGSTGWSGSASSSSTTGSSTWTGSSMNRFFRGSSVMAARTASRSDQPAFHAYGEQVVPGAQVEGQGDQHHQDDQRRASQFLAGGPVHPGEFRPHLVQVADDPLPDRRSPARQYRAGRALQRSSRLHVSCSGHRIPSLVPEPALGKRPKKKKKLEALYKTPFIIGSARLPVKPCTGSVVG